jgi:hypothetical protein
VRQRGLRVVVAAVVAVVVVDTQTFLTPLEPFPAMMAADERVRNLEAKRVVDQIQASRRIPALDDAETELESS